MEDSVKDALWREAEQRHDHDRFDFAGGRLLAMTARSWVQQEEFDPSASVTDFAAFVVSVAVRHREDDRAWKLVTQRQFEIVNGKLFVPLVGGAPSTQPQLTAMIKDVALVSLARRADDEFLTPPWFADLDALLALSPARLDGCHASDALVTSLVHEAVAEHKIVDDAPGRAIEKLSSAGAYPTADTWCTLAMSVSDRWTPSVSTVLARLKVRRPLPSEFIQKIPTEQFTEENAVHFARAVGFLGTSQ